MNMKTIIFYRSITGLFAVMALWTLTSCSPEQPPEVQLRTLVDKGELAAERRELGPLRQLISEHYGDERGYDKKQIVGMVRFYLLGHQKIHLLTKISGIDIIDDKRSQLTVFAAMSGKPISGAQNLISIKAKLMRFDISFAKEGNDWKVITAVWRQAQIDDFL
ncbi:MAG TPA: hypothetical protein ENI80_05415 [Acidiferrobacteraceae bacterium]|nr:hypothetical protein [Acidiferrobacteraceae bacterium]